MPKRKFTRKRYKRGMRRHAKPLTYKQTKAIGKIARKEIHREAELKVVDASLSALTNVGGFDGSDIGNIRTLDQMPAQGTLANQRLGDEIFIKSMQLKGDIDCGTNQVTSSRVIAVQDLESDVDGPLTLRDVLQTPYNNAGLTSFYRSNPARKFKVLSDKMYYWDSNTASAPQPWEVNLKNLGKRKVTLDNTGVKGNIGMVSVFAIGNGATSTTDLRNLQYRMRYYDN